MKTLVISLVIAATSVLNSAFAAAPSVGFAYNTDTDSTGVTTQYVYKKTPDGRYLRHHLKHCYTYDDAHRLLSRATLRWDAASGDYRPAYALHYAYAADASVSVELALWNPQTEDYTDVREKAVYAADDRGITYQAYEYDAASDAWQLTRELATEAALLAAY